MARPVIDKERCKGCSLCVVACPKKILEQTSEINSSGYHPPFCMDEGKCIGCAFCAMSCPDIAIEVYK